MVLIGFTPHSAHGGYPAWCSWGLARVVLMGQVVLDLLKSECGSGNRLLMP